MLNNTTIKYLGFGSPLMDMIADIEESHIKKYDLKLNETIHQKMSETNVFTGLENDVAITYVPGGCSYNAMRIFNWMLGNPNSTALLGSVGNDSWGYLYEDLLSKENVIPIFEKYDCTNTGVCSVFCHNRDRGHITDLGASTLISMDYVNRNWDLFKNVELIYTELFILKHRKDIVYKLADFAECKNKKFGFNLPSFYFIETFLEDIFNLIKSADIVFSNLEEAKFFGHKAQFEDVDNIETLVKQMVKLPKKNKQKDRICVITCGPEPAYVAQYSFVKEEFVFIGKFSPVCVDEDNIVDTNGAGDAFAGGFLSGYVQKKTLEECCQAGHWAASVIIQTRGCQIPESCEFSYAESNN